jgi:predicted nucleotidyltransferase
MDNITAALAGLVKCEVVYKEEEWEDATDTRQRISRILKLLVSNTHILTLVFQCLPVCT